MKYAVSIETKQGMMSIYNNFTIEAQGKAEALDKCLKIMNALAGDFSDLHITAEASLEEKELNLENKDE